MAIVFKKEYPIPMPAGAEIVVRRGEKVARWESGKGQVRYAKVLDDGRVLFVSDCWYIRYRNADGVMTRETTGLRDKQAAEKFLADTLARMDKVKAGVMSVDELAVGDRVVEPIGRHVEDYLAQLAVQTLRGRRVSPKHVSCVTTQLWRVVRECGFKRLKDVNRQAVQRLMQKMASQPRDPSDADSEPLAARTINMHRSAIVAFCGWCVDERRMPAHPLAGLPKAEEGDPARKRRPLNEDEIGRLFKVALERPLLEALTIRTGKNRGKPLANVRPEVRAQLQQAGRVRALAYKFMVLTGLRRNEMATLTVGSLCLDDGAGASPHVNVVGRHAKSAKTATLPLRTDLAAELRTHIATLATANAGTTASTTATSSTATASMVATAANTADTATASTRRRPRENPPPTGNSLPPGCCEIATMPPETPLFQLDWRNLLRTLNRDLAAAGIPKIDAQGRTVDVHAMRHTFATLMARSGVMPATAQKLMRHSDIRLTMNIYTHLDLADTAGAVAALPTF